MPSGVFKRKPFTEEHRRNIGLGSLGRIPWNKGNGKYLTRLQRLEIKAGRNKPENCEICGIHESNFSKSLHFDHNHGTGEFRGWICHSCNTALGLVNDDIEILNKLINYLSQARKK